MCKRCNWENVETLSLRLFHVIVMDESTCWIWITNGTAGCGSHPSWPVNELIKWFRPNIMRKFLEISQNIYKILHSFSLNSTNYRCSQNKSYVNRCRRLNRHTNISFTIREFEYESCKQQIQKYNWKWKWIKRRQIFFLLLLQK